MAYPARVQTAYASSARTATPATVDLNVEAAHGLVLVIDVTAVTSTPSVVFNIDGLDVLTGNTWTLLDSAAITGTGTTILRIAPELSASGNLIAKDTVPVSIRIAPVHGNGNSITYTLTVHSTI